jgi:D-lactate dehydrogenase
LAKKSFVNSLEANDTIGSIFILMILSFRTIQSSVKNRILIMAEIIEALKNIVGDANVLTREMDTAYYRSGFRCGFGDATAVVFPSTLVEQWKVLQVAVDAGCAIIMQAAKTGLTGGSSPSGCEYDRDVVIINVSRLRGLRLFKEGTQAVAFPGTTLFELSQELKKIDRVPHSVLGSTSIGATVIGGVANNAGGALCKRGSSYTEFALYARVNEQGTLELINHLGIRNLGETPEEILTRLEAGAFTDADLIDDGRVASDVDYVNRIRNLDADVPNRYNADPTRLYEASGSAGKVACFAVRVDTFPAPKKKQVFILGTNDPNHFVKMRRHILGTFVHLPEMVEYMNQSTFTIAEKYAKDVALAIKYLGTERLPKAYALKAKAEYLLNKSSFLPKYLPDIFLYYVSKLFPQHLPKRLLEYRDTYEHLLILVTADEAIDEARRYLETIGVERTGLDFSSVQNANKRRLCSTDLALRGLEFVTRTSTKKPPKRFCHSTSHYSATIRTGSKISPMNSPRTWCWTCPTDTTCATCFTISTCIARALIWNG